MLTLIRHLGFALRILIAQGARGATILAVCTLGLGIGVTSAVLCVAERVLLAPLSYPGANRVYTLSTLSPQNYETSNSGGIASLALLEAARGTAGVEDATGFWRLSPILVGPDYSERVPAIVSNANLLAFFGANPIVGRTFAPEESQAGASPVAIVSQAFAEAHFGTVAKSLDQHLSLFDRSFQVVGVLPTSFFFVGAVRPHEQDVWLNLGALRDVLKDASTGAIPLVAYVRISPGSNTESIERHLNVSLSIFPRSRFDESGPLVTRLFSLRKSLTLEIRPMLSVLFGASLVVLLIACLNVAGMLAARGVTRRREFAVRMALGARRTRIGAQIFHEAALLAVSSGALGALLAFGGVSLLTTQSWSPVHEVRLASVSIVTIVSCGGLAIAAMLIIGATPAVQAMRTPLNAMMKDNTAGSGVSLALRRILDGLIIIELALVVALLASAGMFNRSLTDILFAPRGFDINSVAFASYAFIDEDSTSAAEALELAHRVLDRAREVRGVSLAAVSTGVPASGNQRVASVTAETQHGDRVVRDISTVAFLGDYFGSMGIPSLGGLTPNQLVDGTVLLDKVAAERLFPGENPLGREVRWSRSGIHGTVVGLVGDVLEDRFDDNATRHRVATPHLYFPFSMQPLPYAQVIVRNAWKSAPVAPGLTDALRHLDRRIVAVPASSLRETVALTAQRDHTLAFLVSIFAGISVFLAGVSVFGVVSYATQSRTREFGIRIALGATPYEIVRVATARMLGLAGVGALLGIATTAAADRVMRKFLFEITPSAAATVAEAALAMIVIAVAAALWPAIRTTRHDPQLSIRAQ